MEKKRFIVGSKSDKASMRHLGRIILSLREAFPRCDFLSWHEVERNGGSNADECGDLNSVLHLLGKKEIDLAIADVRDVPLRGFAKADIAAVTRRGNPFDVLISDSGKILDELPEKSNLMADMPVRVGQLLFYRPDLNVLEEREDFDHLYSMISRGEINGFVYAASDVEVMNQQDKVAEVFTSSICMPLAGQGAQMLIVRKNDEETLGFARELNDAPSAEEVELERAFMNLIAKNGRGPVGVLASIEGPSFKIEAVVAAHDGSEKVSSSAEGKLDKKDSVLEKIAKELLESGAAEILKREK